MVIAIQKGIKKLRDELIQRGYTVVEAESYGYPIDAIIYEDTNYNVSHISIDNMPSAENSIRPNFGVLMINSRNKSVDEIVEILNRRCYTPLLN